MLVKVGSYTGDGVDGSEIPVGFEPVAIFVKREDSSDGIAMRTDTMSGDETALLIGDAALVADHIQSFVSTGFTIGTDSRVNLNNATYHYIALGDDGGEDIDTVTYTGNATDNRSITTSIDPDMVIVTGDNAADAVWRTDELAGDLAQSFNAHSIGDRIQSLGTGSFEVGTRDEVNSDTVTYHALCLKRSEGVFNIVEYTGDGQDDRTVTGVGFQPTGGWVQEQDIGATYCNARFVDLPAGESINFAIDHSLTDGIKSFDADGFTVGTGAQANDASQPFTAVMFTDAAATATGLSRAPNITNIASIPSIGE